MANRAETLTFSSTSENQDELVGNYRTKLDAEDMKVKYLATVYLNSCSLSNGCFAFDVSAIFNVPLYFL